MDVARRVRTRRFAVSVVALAALAGAALAVQSPAPSAAAGAAALSRIHGPLPARAADTAKLDSRLAALVTAPGTHAFVTRGWRLTGVPALVRGAARVEILAIRPAAARAAVAKAGGHVLRSWRTLIEATVPTRSLVALSQSTSVRFVRPPAQGVPDDVPGEEVQASLADAIHAQGITGKGVKVAIIDESFAGLAARQASGDLPANVVTQDLCGGQLSSGEGHGTAVAEIVHEMAPDAQLYLICFADLVEFAAAESYAKSQGIQIVNHSVEYFNEGRGTGDASDPIDTIIADAKAHGILWVNSAGNDAQTHWSGTFSDTNGDKFTEFAPGDEANSFVVPIGGHFCGLLKWDEWPAAASNFDLALVNPATGQVLAMSSNVQSGTQPPTEDLCLQNQTGTNVLVAWAIYGANVKTSPRFDLYSLDTSQLKYQTAAGSIGDPASSPAVLGVGAVCWQNNVLEPYSSQGPTVDGRLKPDISGHDSVSSATFGAFASSCPSGFAGTSASSPEVAGAAALVKQASPSASPDQIASLLEKSATDLGPAGADNLTGAGVLHLPSSLLIADTTPPVAKALASSGRRGQLVKLRSRVSDDSGELTIRDQVKKNGRVIKTLSTGGFVQASTTPQVGYFAWKPPAHLTGAITHCVRAQDRAGNLSPTSCAKVSLSG